MESVARVAWGFSMDVNGRCRAFLLDRLPQLAT